MISVKKYAQEIDEYRTAWFEIEWIQKLRDDIWANGYEDDGVLYWGNGDPIATYVLENARMRVPDKQKTAEYRRLNRIR